MVVGIGQQIVLSIKVLKNGRPLTGKTTVVRVARSDDGSTLLATTSAPETTEPGLYSFLWTSPPAEETTLVAIFTVDGKEVNSEFIDIIKTGATSGAGEISVVMDVDEDQEVSANVDEIDVIAVVEDP